MDEVLPKPTNVKALKAVLDEIIEDKDNLSPMNSPLLGNNNYRSQTILDKG